MSLILDALRKSEHERQRQADPAMPEMPVIRPHQRQAPVLALAIAGLVAVNLAVLAWFLLRAPVESTRAPAYSPPCCLSEMFSNSSAFEFSSCATMSVSAESSSFARTGADIRLRPPSASTSCSHSRRSDGPRWFAPILCGLAALSCPRAFAESNVVSPCEFAAQ